MSAEREFDFVIYGASGFTGQYVVEELATVLQADGSPYSWAVAGRSESKLRAALNSAAGILGLDLGAKTIIVCDSSEPESLAAMAKRARVVLNCVGPYRFYGEPVVKACAEAGTSHVDISGEPSYLEKMQADYSEEANKNGCYIVGACGWDSIPFDMGIEFMTKNFDGTLNDIEGVTETHPAPGYKINYGTFASMIHGVANRGGLGPVRRRIMPTRPDYGKHKIAKRATLFFHDEAGGWCLPFLGSDKSVAERSQYLHHADDEETRPIQVRTYMKFTSAAWAVATAVWGVCFAVMASFSFTRGLLEAYPELLSFGLFSKDGPTRKQMDGTSFTYNLFGRGWASGADKDQAPNKRVHVQVTGPDPGYMATARFIVAAALTIREEAKQLPAKGGVFPPGAAFAGTGLVERLGKRGISYKVLA